MNRRSLLSFFGLAPVAVATGAVAAAQTPKTEVVKLDIDLAEFRKSIREEFLAVSGVLPAGVVIETVGGETRLDVDSKYARRAWEKNIKLRAKDGGFRLQEFASADDDCHYSLSNSRKNIIITNTAKRRTALLPTGLTL